MWKVVGAALLLIGITEVAILCRRRWPHLLVGWFWYVGMTFPVLGLVSISNHAMADRYTYLPGIGIYVALAWTLERLAAHSRQWRWAIVAATTLAVATLVVLARWQTEYWSDDVLLWTHTLAVTDDNAKAEWNLAHSLMQRGRLDEAVEHFLRAERWEKSTGLYNNLGTALAIQGKLDKAQVQFQKALQINPKDPDAYVNLGN